MKNTRLVSWQLFLLIVSAYMVTACSSDNDQDPKPAVEETTGTISFTLPSGITATSTSPAMATQGQPLDMEISQKSSYTDPNGSVYTCEPKASIKLMVKQDTLYAKDLKTLVSITESSDVSESGTNPCRHQTLQKFIVGGQEVVFDLAHEVYTYVNSRQTTIEMPYIKVNPAKYGAAMPKETRSATPVGVSAIRLKPLGAVTRGQTVTTSQAYEVNVSFNLELESVNTKETTRQTLSFEANYIGIVESSTELPDPVTSFSYQLNIQGGTKSSASPFEVTKGEVLSLEWAQNSRYTYFSATELSGKTVSEMPKAAVKLSVAKDTLWINSAEELDKVTTQAPVVATSGENPIVHTVNQSFDVGGQTISLDWSYDSYAPFTIEGNIVNLPYLEFANAEVVSVSKTELSGVTIPGKEAKVYEVTVKFRQGLKGVNMPESVSENEEYVVKYIAALEVKLMSTTYEKDYMWAEPHDNLSWRSTYIVRRIRTYSTGEQEIDTFTAPSGWSVGLGGYFTQNHQDTYPFVYHDKHYDAQNDDFRFVRTTKTGVPNIDYVSWETYDDVDTWGDRNLTDYTVVHYNINFDPANPIEAWYHGSVVRWKRIEIKYDDPEYGEWIRREGPEIAWTDKFLYLDGQIIDFSDFKMTSTFNTKVKSTSLPDGSPAKVFTHECNAKYLGKDFYIAIVDTIYQLQSAQQTMSVTKSPSDFNNKQSEE